MKNERLIINITTLVDNAIWAHNTIGTTPWWRGQASSSWKLVPRIHRKKTTNLHETSLAAQFKSKAPTRHFRCPLPNDNAGWLFLMQHYRLATRLLDWSESPLIALFFAVTERMNENGSLYVLDPSALNNHQTDVDAIMASDYHMVIPLFDAAIATNAPQISKILAVGTNQVDNRMLAQASQFTIHDIPDPIESLAYSEKFLTRFEIPATAKQQIRNELFALGIRESVVFPDLEHLAHELEERYQIDKLEDRFQQ